VNTVGLDDLRYRQLGNDPIAKQLYASTFAALKAFVEAKRALTDYLDQR
jgi:hypothetical protein